MKKILLFALLLGFVSLWCVDEAQAQDSRTVAGVVVDESGVPLGGASVMLRATTQGTSTDNNGRFSIRVPVSGNVILNIRYLGYENASVTVGAETTFRIVMKPSALTTGQVVVTGMATIDKSDYTGSIVQLNMEQIYKPGMSVEQMLQGHVAGMSVVNITGKVGGTPQIRVRGTSTIMGNQNPLWVVDGVIQQDLLPLPDKNSPIYAEMANLRQTAGSAISWLNPSDIESITILKDASATAIYGSAASNGVIVITTKKASSQGLTVSYSGDFSVGQKAKYSQYDFMNSQQQMWFQQQMWEDRDNYNSHVPNVGFGQIIKELQSGQISEAEYAQKFRTMEMQNTDWFDALMRNSFSQKHNVSISGVGDKVHSRFSLGFDRQNSEAKENNLQSFTAASSSTYRLEDKLTVDLQLSGSYRQTRDYAFGVSPYEYALTTSRTIPIYNEDGSLHFYEHKERASSRAFPDKEAYRYNILNEIANTGAGNDNLSLGASLNVTAKILDNLHFRGSASYSLNSGVGKSWATERSFAMAKVRGWDTFDEVLPGSPQRDISRLPHGGQLIRDNSMGRNYALRGNLAWNKTFNDAHKVLVQLGAEASSSSMKGNSDMRYGYLHYRGMGFAEVPATVDNNLDPLIADIQENDLHQVMQRSASVTDTKDNKVSQFLTAIYNYKDRYVMNFNARLDASNRFGQDQNKKFNPGWSLGFKWRAGNEPFMEWAQEWLYNFDVSASYGWRGNAVQAVSPYLIANIPDNGGFSSFFDDQILTIGSLPYPGLGWERKQDWNFGLDFTFFEGRVSLLAEYYGSRADVLTAREVPTHNGVATAYIDGTVMKNSGWELTVSATPVRTENFAWTLSFNTSRENNKVRNDKIDYDVDDYITGVRQIDGYAYGSFWVYDFIGLNGSNGYPIFNYISDGYGLPAPTSNPLDYLVWAGSSEPKFYGGLSTNFRWKNWNLSTSFAMSFGNMKFLPAVYPSNGVPTPDTNVPLYLNDRWRKPGDEMFTDIPSIPGGSREGMVVYLPNVSNDDSNQKDLYALYNQSTAQLAKGDFVRCRNISLSYDVPLKYAGRIGARRVTLSASLSNPFVIAFDKKWKGRDPESGSWPARRMTSFSLNVSF